MTIQKHYDLDRSLSYAAAKALLEKERATGRATPEGLITNLHLRQIALASSVFQARQLQEPYQQYLSDAHSETLKTNLKASPTQTLEAIIVWWSGKRWIALDGHHRVEAYRRQERDAKGTIQRIPVVTFEGSLEAAIAKSIELNARDKLPMTYDDKANAAWKLIVEETLSKSEISRVTTVHRNTLTAMGKALNSLKQKYPISYKDEALAMTWDEARRSEVGRRELGDFEGYAPKINQQVAKVLNSVRGRKPLEPFIPFVMGGLSLLDSEAPLMALRHLIGEYPELARDELEWRMTEPEF